MQREHTVNQVNNSFSHCTVLYCIVMPSYADQRPKFTKHHLKMHPKVSLSFYFRRLPSHPVYAEEWADPRSPRLQVLSMCWRSCLGQPLDGDIVAYDGIVGIVTGSKKLTFSDPDANPSGLIKEVQSKYVPQKHGVCWRYTC